MTLTVLSPLAAEDYPKLSPFAAVRWKDATPEVQVNKVWYELLALNDLEAKKVVEFCQKTYKDRWQKRFEEDLVEVLTVMGHKPQRHVSLKVRQFDTGATRVLDKVEMTEENRRALWQARQEKEGKGKPPDAGRPGGRGL